MSKEEIIGTYRKNQKGFGFVKIEDQEDEIYISRENSKNALNGDTVAIKIIAEKEGDKKQEGKIVKIVRHEKDTVVGTFQKVEILHLLFLMIRILEQIYLYQKLIGEKQEIRKKY